MFVGIAVEVPFAGEPSPAAEGSEGDNLATIEGGIGAGSSAFGLMKLAKIVNHDIECGAEGRDTKSLERSSSKWTRDSVQGNYPLTV